MSRPIRSKHGCWTCRLRKKKCDEHQPQCETCESLSITCYGYGEKPEWMDNGTQERAIAEGIKQIVKVTSRRKATVHIHRTQQDRALAPKPSRDASPSPSGKSEDVGVISTEESILLMHFFDEVFPLQYPVYKPDALMAGRGWLLHLLLRTKPLYHAALALSAYHRMVVGFARISPQCRAFATVRQEEQLEICLKEVRRTIRDMNQFVQKKQSCYAMGLLASVVQLVFFELFAGEDGAWQIHLDAAIDMYQKGCRDRLAHCGLTEKSKTFLCDNLPLEHFDPEDDGPTIVQEVVTFRFMEVTIIWFDLVASITAGNAPKLLSYHPRGFQSLLQIRLENVVGCPGWLALQIGRIANLHYKITQAKQLELLFDCAESAKDADAIHRDIQTGLPSAREISPISPTDTVFANMAIIYLHLVIHGFQQLSLLDNANEGIANS
ncbi:Zn(II)2Cys6 transcription factor [Aspergillus undulatus]|uniref:Zn(II)2Cys6 transcription factor n=1 Tax=Aspergillus undulatus TaxID=1810928 RepID=UPI003CCD8EE5